MKTKTKISHILIRRIVSMGRHRGYDLGYLIFGFMLILFFRWNIFRFPFSLNPDEAQLAANTLRISQYGFNWDSFDGTTSGPLNSLILCWPYLFGLDVTWTTTRITATCLIGIILASIYFSVKKINTRIAATVVTMPLFVLFGTTDHYDFLHYSIELLSLSLVSAATYYLFKLLKDFPHPEIKAPVLIFVGISLGAVPFAKLQLSLIAVTLAAMIFALLWINKKKCGYKNLLIILFSLMVPAIIIILPLVVSGNLGHFYNSYLLWASLYIKNSLDWYQLYKFISSITMYKLTVLFLLICGLASVVVYLNINTKPDRAKIVAWVCSFILLITAIYSVMRPGNQFHHYLLLILPFLAMNIGVIICSLKNLPNRWGIKIFFYLLLIINSIAFLDKTKDNIISNWKLIANASDFNLRLSFTSPKLLSWIGSDATEKLLIWGWMPQYYLLTGMTPATRETHTYAQIVNSDLKNYFRSRLLEDFSESSPDFVVDAVSASSFRFQDPITQGLDIFPELNNLIQNNFTMVTNTMVTGNCPKLYIRNTRIQEFIRQTIPIHRISVSNTYHSPNNAFSARKLTDNSFFEESCTDYWLLPDGQQGNVHVDFSTHYPVRKILILNTHNGRDLDRATKDVRISIKRNGIVAHETIIHMKPYPEWTIYKPANVIIGDSVELSVLSYYGKGGGMNEIKIFQ